MSLFSFYRRYETKKGIFLYSRLWSADGCDAVGMRGRREFLYVSQRCALVFGRFRIARYHVLQCAYAYRLFLGV